MKNRISPVHYYVPGFLLVFVTGLLYSIGMYHAKTAKELRQFLKLEDSYKVDGFLSYGAWDEEKHFRNLHFYLKELGISYSQHRFTGFLNHVLELRVLGRVYWFAVMYGGALLSEYTHLACMLGSKRNIHMGGCGGLFPEMNANEILIPEWSYGNESETRFYARGNTDNKHYPDKALFDMIKSGVGSVSKVWTGPTMTSQAMLGEIPEDVEQWSKEGYYGVEMDAATVFAVSNHFMVPSAALLYVSGNLTKGHAVGGLNYGQEHDRREAIKQEMYLIGINMILK